MEGRRSGGKPLKVSVCAPPGPVECLLQLSIDLVMMVAKVKMMMKAKMLMISS